MKKTRLEILQKAYSTKTGGGGEKERGEINTEGVF